MWIIYLIAGILAIPVVLIAGLVLYARHVYQQDIQTAKTTSYSPVDPLLAELDPDQPALVYFTSDLCAPCKTTQTPAIKALQEEMPDLQLITVNVQEQPEIADRWKVKSLPRTFVIGKNRQVSATNIDVALMPLLKTQIEEAQNSSTDSVQVHAPPIEIFKLPAVKFGSPVEKLAN